MSKAIHQQSNTSAATSTVGADQRRRGFFWASNDQITDLAPLLGLDGVGLLASYDVWCDRRDGSASSGFAFPSREDEAHFYGLSRQTLVDITDIAQALELLIVEVRVIASDNGTNDRTPKNFYRLIDRQRPLCADDVIAVLRLAEHKPTVFRRIAHIFKTEFAPIDRSNIWHHILPVAREHPLWKTLAARAQKRAESYSARRRQTPSVVTDSYNAPEPRSLSVTAVTDSDPKQYHTTTTTTTVRAAVWAHFARQTGATSYAPTPKDNLLLDQLLTDGFGLDQICVGIDLACQRFVAARRPGRIGRFAYCIPVIRETSSRSVPADPAVAAAPAESTAPVDVDHHKPGEPASSAEVQIPDAADATLERVFEAFSAVNGRPTNDAERHALSRLARDFNPIALADPHPDSSSGAQWVVMAIHTLFQEGSARGGYLALKPIRSLLERWQQQGFLSQRQPDPAEVKPRAQSFTSRAAIRQPTTWSDAELAAARAAAETVMPIDAAALLGENA
ncbi:MAG: hypothetical protein JW934_19440 [Anaerolineae bacterium]|nr:hypothetical protein [Anaerolineae bacterium]